MAAQVAFAELRPVLVIGIRQLRHPDVGLDTAFLHRPAGRRVIARRRQLERGRIGQRQHRLHAALAEAALAHHQCAMLILKRARDDLGGRGRPGIDQHDDRQALRIIAGLGIIALNIALVAAALRNDLAAFQKCVAH